MADDTRNEPRIDPDEILAGIREWVEIETPSGDGAAVNVLVDRVQQQVAQLGMTDATLLDATVNALADHDGAALFTVIDQVIDAGRGRSYRLASACARRARSMCVDE